MRTRYALPKLVSVAICTVECMRKCYHVSLSVYMDWIYIECNVIYVICNICVYMSEVMTMMMMMRHAQNES